MTMGRFPGGVMVVVVVSLWIKTIEFSWCSEDSSLLCLESERRALLSLKNSLTDTSNRLSSWVGEDCCRWKGVGCNNKTRHVVKLNLRNPHPLDENRFVEKDGNIYDAVYSMACLVGFEVNSSLLELKHLNYLDLSWNNFTGIKIPNFFGSFRELRYLNLSSSWFSGFVPHHLGNLSSLQSLDLSTHSLLYAYYFDVLVELSVENLHWISHLSSLQGLNMTYVNLNMASNWLQVIHLLPSLSELRLSHCLLDTFSTPSLQNVNFTSLAILDLSGNNFQGPIPNARQNMTSLEVLDLSDNYFNSTIPLWLGNFNHLSELSLRHNEFNGPIPGVLGNLCNLQILRLSYNQFSGEIAEFFGNSFSGCIGDNLKRLSFSLNQLRGHLPDRLGQLKNLEYLYLGDNSFSGPIPASLGNLLKLRVLYLSFTQLSGPIPKSLGRLSTLSELGLAYNQLNGLIPASLGRLLNLGDLNLGYNRLNGPIPSSLGNLSNLRVLFLKGNQLNGTVPRTLGQISKLERLDLSDNSFDGVVSEAHFAKLSRLKYLDLSSNSLVLKTRSSWIPPFQLEFISMGSCEIGPQFPVWLRTQTNFTWLNLSMASISDSVPNWFTNLSFNLIYLDLSLNQIHGKVPNFFKSENSDKRMTLYLYSNNFEGPLPSFPSGMYLLDLSSNSISGHIPQNIGDMMPMIEFLILSGNLIKGTIPTSLCKMMNLQVLDLSKNNLSGELPQCWSDLQGLEVISLTSNYLSGVIPSSLGYLSSLKSLHLSKNRFYGELPSALKNCTSLSILDLGENQLSGNIPTWIDERLLWLSILRLRSNMFDGSIHSQLCHLNHLHLLDLAHNNLSGTIPHCFHNFDAMVLGQKIEQASWYDTYFDKLMAAMKGRELEYTKILSLVINMDLSSNSLVGEIPEELTFLTGLHGLNLSRNHLLGSIPKKIGDLRFLESLDLSRNQLSGTIPQSMSFLTSLSYLDLSYNKLSGQIPAGNQLQTLDDPSMYKGNPELCGAPLEKKCFRDEPPQAPIADDNEGRELSEEAWFFIGMACGCVIGFWGFCGILLFKKTWRYSYFRFVEDTKDKLLVAIEVRVARMKKKLKCNKVEE